MIPKLKQDSQEQKNNSPEQINHPIDTLLREGKLYYPAKFLANEFSYATDHIARLARQEKLDARYQKDKKRWYVTRESLTAYRIQAEQNKVLGGLKSTSTVLSNNHSQKDFDNSGNENTAPSDFALGSSLENISNISTSGSGPKIEINVTSPSTKNLLNFTSEYLSKVRKAVTWAELVAAFSIVVIVGTSFINLNLIRGNHFQDPALIGSSIPRIIKDFFFSFFDSQKNVVDSNNSSNQSESEKEVFLEEDTQTLTKENGPGQTSVSIVKTLVDSTAVQKLVKQFFNEEKLSLPPFNTTSILGSIDDFKKRIDTVEGRVNQIPPPLAFSGPTIVNQTFGSTESNISGSQISGSTLSISGSTTLNNVGYTWPSADGSVNQRLTTSGDGVLSWATVSGGGVSSNSLGFGALVDSPVLDADFNISRAGFFLGIGAAPTTVLEVQGTASASYLLTGNTLQV